MQQDASVDGIILLCVACDGILVFFSSIWTIWTVRRSEFDGPDPMQYADVTCIISDPEGHFREKKYFELI